MLLLQTQTNPRVYLGIIVLVAMMLGCVLLQTLALAFLHRTTLGVPLPLNNTVFTALRSTVSIYKPREHVPPHEVLLQQLKGAAMHSSMSVANAMRSAFSMTTKHRPSVKTTEAIEDNMPCVNTPGQVDSKHGTGKTEAYSPTSQAKMSAIDLCQVGKEAQPTAQSALPVLPVTLTFKDVRYFVPLVKKEQDAVTKDPAARLELLKVRACMHHWLHFVTNHHRASPAASALAC